MPPVARLNERERPVEPYTLENIGPFLDELGTRMVFDRGIDVAQKSFYRRLVRAGSQAEIVVTLDRETGGRRAYETLRSRRHPLPMTYIDSLDDRFADGGESGRLARSLKYQFYCLEPPATLTTWPSVQRAGLGPPTGPRTASSRAAADLVEAGPNPGRRDAHRNRLERPLHGARSRFARQRQ